MCLGMWYHLCGEATSACLRVSSEGKKAEGTTYFFQVAIWPVDFIRPEIHTFLFELVSQPQDCTARTIKIFNLATILTESRHSISLDESTAQASYLIFGSVDILN